ncbi:histidine-rich glycoprotein [Antrostomus carolinensis]|uniref:histidine-rich glycoprotein n=1 Tax=Antrostomus carolinensis TaxID=279965 RepID=UPI000528BC23|nr:histidine-rich glycoprotein [Antrostomus carolinensis]
MLLLASAFFLTLLQCSDAQNKTSITPADCNTIETDAGVALDLVNRHRRDGYVFGLFRVADAHKLHIGNSSVLFLTLDVLETECSVLSRKHWESCDYGDTYFMDFGQCKIIIYTSQLLKKPQLYGFNCTLSPVPPDLLECKDCPVKVEVLEVTEQHKNIAAKALEKFNREGNHTNYFNVDKVEKILKMTASREGHILGFSIKETNCSKSAQQANQALECDFLDDWHAHVGFCKARIISHPEEPDGTDINCEIYHRWQHDHGQRCKHSTLGHRHRHPHHHFGHRHRHRHHHRHHHRHGCPPFSQPRPEDPEHNHSFNEEHQDSHEEPAPPPHSGPHQHLPPPPPHDGPHPPPQEEPQPPPSVPPPYEAPHPLLQEEAQYDPSAPSPHDEPHNPPLHPHHGPHCPPPPHGPHHHHPPPHCGPHCPPPPPHGPHHHHPPPHCGPRCPPPPPHGPHHHHPPPHCGPHHPPPPGHPPHLCHHYYRHHCNKTSISGKYSPFQITGALYRIPVLNQQDSLTPPTANFPELSQSNPHSSSTAEGIPFTGSSLKEMLEALSFPDHPAESKSCPGKPKLVLPKILPLFPHSSMAENSPP